MKYFNLITALLTIIVFTSCGSSDDESGTTESIPTTPANTTVSTDTATKKAVQATTTTTMPAPAITTNNQPQAPAINTGGTGPNPEHGKPGHRCDIAVGDPLNSKPTQAATTPAITTGPQQVVSKANPTGNVPSLNIQPATGQKNPIVINPPANASAAAGLNPEHGKPGHRCDIAVGAPLNSQPTAAAQPAAVNATPQPTIKSTPTTLTAPPVITAAGMNPEHGKPGHRCDIAVGAPLNSKPGQ